MRPLPRLHAITDAALLSHPELGIRAAAIAAAGSAVALHARARGSGGALLASAAQRLLSLARPPEATVFVNARSDVAAAVGAHGVQLGRDDLTPADARRVLRGWIGCSVHTMDEAAAAVKEGADFLVVGNVYESASHPGRPAAGLDLVRQTSRLGLPIIAIGGITAARAPEVWDAGAYGVAAIRALWEAPDPAAAALDLLRPWAAAE
ncbi:MAG TPA: thiamine phosphate synthase [Gemmatimonadales bacterium]|nr:thiamine phosphate synthase [Gemmatimonadales bacterium]